MELHCNLTATGCIPPAALLQPATRKVGPSRPHRAVGHEEEFEMTGTTRRFVSGLTVIVAAAALIAPSALAARPDDRANHGVGATVAVAPDAFERASIRATATAPDAFERAAIRGPSLPAPDAFERAAQAQRPDDRSTVRGPVVGTTQSGGFDVSWAGSLVFLSAGLGLLLVLGGLLATRRRHRIATH